MFQTHAQFFFLRTTNFRRVCFIYSLKQPIIFIIFIITINSRRCCSLSGKNWRKKKLFLLLRQRQKLMCAMMWTTWWYMNECGRGKWRTEHGKQTAACRWSIICFVCHSQVRIQFVFIRFDVFFSLFFSFSGVSGVWSVDHWLSWRGIHCFNGHRLIVSPSVWRRESVRARARTILLHVRWPRVVIVARMNCKMGECERAQTAFQFWTCRKQRRNNVNDCRLCGAGALTEARAEKWIIIINKHYHALGIRTFCFCSLLSRCRTEQSHKYGVSRRFFFFFGFVWMLLLHFRLMCVAIKSSV